MNTNSTIVIHREKIGFWTLEGIWFFIFFLWLFVFIQDVFKLGFSNIDHIDEFGQLFVILLINVLFLYWYKSLKLELHENSLIYRTLLGGKIDVKYSDIQRAYVKIGFNDMGTNRPLIRIEIEMKQESRQDNFFIKLGAFKESEWPVVFDKLNISEKDRDLKFLGKIQKFKIGKKTSKKK